ncbi:alanine/glycine:cation symporter family protein [Lachnoclostridium sp.]|nr:amino acid carrier protein [Lachnoclostridium sp.]
MNDLLKFIQTINHYLWGGPMLFLLFGTHLYFTFRLRFIQKELKKGIRNSVSTKTDTHGNSSSFKTLTTTLAATLGTGNIVGISTAIALGGPGAVLWCWLTGVFGMATTYAECYLGMRYRKQKPDGTYRGGPMYALEYGLHSKWLAVIFCVATLFVAFSMGGSTQARSITDATKALGISPYLSGIIVAFLIGLVIVGGVNSIQNVCMKLVPAMAIFYVAACVLILFVNLPFVLPALSTIVKTAFSTKAVAGGVLGGSISIAARYGISRGLFTNEAGLGSAAIAAGGSALPDDSSLSGSVPSSNTTKDTQYHSDSLDLRYKNQALVSMSATFWDTVVMCALTGLIIVSTILKNPDSIKGLSMSELTTAAFAQIPFGVFMLRISLVAFAVATLIGWSFFGEKAVEYLFPKKGIDIYRLVYILMIFFGSIMSLELVWESSDLINAFMTIPNLIALWLLRKKIKC